jgi:hypothetical protein
LHDHHPVISNSTAMLKLWVVLYMLWGHRAGADVYSSTRFQLQCEMEVSVQCHTVAALPPEKDQVPIDVEAGWSTQPGWTFFWWENFFRLAFKLIHPACSLVSILTTLPQSHSIKVWPSQIVHIFPRYFIAHHLGP